MAKERALALTYKMLLWHTSFSRNRANEISSTAAHAVLLTTESRRICVFVIKRPIPIGSFLLLLNIHVYNTSTGVYSSFYDIVQVLIYCTCSTFIMTPTENMNKRLAGARSAYAPLYVFRLVQRLRAECIHRHELDTVEWKNGRAAKPEKETPGSLKRGRSRLFIPRNLLLPFELHSSLACSNQPLVSPPLPQLGHLWHTNRGNDKYIICLHLSLKLKNDKTN